MLLFFCWSIRNHYKGNFLRIWFDWADFLWKNCKMSWSKPESVWVIYIEENKWEHWTYVCLIRVDLCFLQSTFFYTPSYCILNLFCLLEIGHLRDPSEQGGNYSYIFVLGCLKKFVSCHKIGFVVCCFYQPFTRWHWLQ